MEEEIDIYADLPNFNLKPDKNEEQTVCDCKELKKELGSLKSKYENIHNVNKNLEKNMASLLKTAKIEIARKNKIIDDLRKQVDNVAFRRSNKSSQQNSLNSCAHDSSHHQRTIAEKHEDIVSPIDSNENDIPLYQDNTYDEEHENKKSQNDVDRIPVTIFGERLHKKIMDEEKKEKRQRALPKLNGETNNRKIPEESVVESDKENGSHSIVNNINESNTIAQNSDLGTSSKKNTGKRLNDEDDTCTRKRLKTEDNDKTSSDTDHNCIAQYDIKNLTKFEDQIDAMHSFKKEQVSLRTENTKQKATFDGAVKQDRSNTDKSKREMRSSSGRDYVVSRTRGGSADDLRNNRAKPHEKFNSNRQCNYYMTDYKKKSYRSDSPSSRSYSRKSDYENSSNHRLRETSSRMHRDKRYDDYEYNNRYRNDKYERDYGSNESNSHRTRHSNREYGDFRERVRHSPNVDREIKNNSTKNNKYDSRKIKTTDSNTKEVKEASPLLQTDSKNTNYEEITSLKSSSKNNAHSEIYNHNNDNDTCKIKVLDTVNVINHRKLHKNDKIATEIDPGTLSSQIVTYNSTDHNVKKNTKEYNPKNESCSNKFVNLTKSASVNAIITDNLEETEEGEIIDNSISPQKEDNYVNVLRNEVTRVNMVSVEDKNENAAVNTSRDNGLIIPQNNAIDMDQLEESGDINAKEMKEASLLLQTNLEDTHHKIVTQLKSSKINAVNEMHYHNNDNGMCKPHTDENLIDSTTQNVQMPTTAERVHDSNIEDENCINSAKKDFKNPSIDNVAIIEEVYIDDNICKIDSEALTNSTATKIEVVPNCDVKDNDDKSPVSIRNDISSQISHNSNDEMSHSCLNDHNYVRYVTIAATKLDITQNPIVNSERKTATEITTSKETKMSRKETVNVLSASVKKTTSPTVKNKKEQSNKKVVVLRRRKAVTLSDNKASMTVLMNTSIAKTSSVVKNSVNDTNDSVSKPRACKLARICKGGL